MNLRSHTQSLIEAAKVAYNTKLATTFASNPRRLYFHLKQLNKSNQMPSSIFYNCSMVDNPATIAQIFNVHFNSTFNNVSNFPIPDPNLLQSPSSQLHHILLDEHEVYDTLVSLDPTKSPGYDNISQRVLRYCAAILAEPDSHF